MLVEVNSSMLSDNITAIPPSGRVHSRCVGEVDSCNYASNLCMGDSTWSEEPDPCSLCRRGVCAYPFYPTKSPAGLEL